MHGVFVKPVVGVDDLEIAALSIGEAGINGRTVTAVGFMDRSNGARIFFLPSIGDFCRIVFRRTVINDKNLNIVLPSSHASSDSMHLSIYAAEL